MATGILAVFVLVLPLAGHAQEHRPGGGPGSPGPRAASFTLSDHARFRVSIAARSPPVAINRMHDWVLHVRTPGGRPGANATVSIAGGNPERGHALPTAPRVTRYLGAGEYLIEGMKFHMAGGWRLSLAITAGRHRDTVSFDIVVR